jgi:phosphoglycerate-specific signal transduction histidine kinase
LELASIKRHMKHTNTAEIEVQVKGYYEECVRIRGMIDEMMKYQMTNAKHGGDSDTTNKINEHLNQQNQLLQNIKVENTELAQAYQIKE